MGSDLRRWEVTSRHIQTLPHRIPSTFGGGFVLIHNTIWWASGLHENSPLPSYHLVTSSRVETPIIDLLRDYVPTLEKYKVVQTFRVEEDRNHKDCNFLDDCIP